jgi:phosphoglycolate phosphatase
MVGDSELDILTALNAGMTPVGVSWGYRPVEVLKETGAELIAHTAAELEAILLCNRDSK